ncbi:hypothetical protein AAY473_040508 [Plecturocebus cupreus]
MTLRGHEFWGDSPTHRPGRSEAGIPLSETPPEVSSSLSLSATPGIFLASGEPPVDPLERSAGSSTPTACCLLLRLLYQASGSHLPGDGGGHCDARICLSLAHAHWIGQWALYFWKSGCGPFKKWPRC